MRRPNRFLRWFAAGALLSVANCRSDIVATNLAAGVRDGLITTVTGIIQGVFDAFFNPDGGDPGAGNDLFIGI